MEPSHPKDVVPFSSLCRIVHHHISAYHKATLEKQKEQSKKFCLLGNGSNADELKNKC